MTTTQNEEQRPRCKANVYDEYSEESRPCMRKASLYAVYCWQHALNRTYGGPYPRQGTQR